MAHGSSKIKNIEGEVVPHTHYVASLIRPFIAPDVFSGVVAVSVGEKQVLVYVKDVETQKLVQQMIDADFSDIKIWLTVRVTGDIVALGKR